MTIPDNSSQFQIDRTNILNSGSSRDAVQKIYGEVDREKEINAIKDESKKSYFETTAGKDLISYLENLKIAKSKLKEWKEMGGLERKLEIEKFPTSPIGKTGKQSLEDLYIMQAKLQQITNNLLQKLHKAGQNSGANIEGIGAGRGEYAWQDVQRALKWIDWKKGDLKFRVRYLDDEKRIVFIPVNESEDAHGWGSWEQNPFRIFFGNGQRGKYRKLMRKLKETEGLLKGLEVGKNMMVTLRESTEAISSDTLKRIDDSESSFKAAVADIILDLEMQVASKLVEWTLPEAEWKELLS